VCSCGRSTTRRGRGLRDSTTTGRTWCSSTCARASGRRRGRRLPPALLPACRAGRLPHPPEEPGAVDRHAPLHRQLIGLAQALREVGVVLVAAEHSPGLDPARPEVAIPAEAWLVVVGVVEVEVDPLVPGALHRVGAAALDRPDVGTIAGVGVVLEGLQGE